MPTRRALKTQLQTRAIEARNAVGTLRDALHEQSERTRKREDGDAINESATPRVGEGWAGGRSMSSFFACRRVSEKGRRFNYDSIFSFSGDRFFLAP